MEILSALLILQSILLISSRMVSAPSQNWISLSFFELCFQMAILFPHDKRSVFPSRKPKWMVKVYFSNKVMNPGAERFNGLMAMLGIVAGVGAYATTGQMIPGVF